MLAHLMDSDEPNIPLWCLYEHMDVQLGTVNADGNFRKKRATSDEEIIKN